MVLFSIRKRLGGLSEQIRFMEVYRKMVKMPMSGKKAVEFVEETTFALMPTGKIWSWIGLIDKYDTPIKKDTESFKYLPDPNDVTGLSKKRTQVVSGTLEGGISYYAQDFAFWKYVMGNASTLGNTLTSITIAQTLEEPDGVSKFIVTKGNILKSLKLTLPVDGVAKCDGSLQRADIADPTTVDPTAAGGGDWEDEDTSDALLWENITDMCMDANAVPTTAVGHIIGDVSLEIVNNVDFPKDVDETTWTKIAGVVLNSHDINVGLRLTYVDVNDTAAPKIHDVISNSTLQNLRFTLGDRIAIIKNLLFTEWNPAAEPEVYLGEELTPETNNADFILAYKMGYAFADDSGFTDETAEANNTTVNNMTLLPAAPAEGDVYYFGRADETFSTLQLNIGTQGVGVWTIIWEYWDSEAGPAAWATCDTPVDGTVGFTAAAGWHDVTHTIQTGTGKNWGKTTINGVEAYWLRARVSAYTSIETQPKGTQCWVYGEVSEATTA